jgi:hypothetical protein
MVILHIKTLKAQGREEKNMYKEIKRFLCVLVVFTLVAGALPVSAEYEMPYEISEAPGMEIVLACENEATNYFYEDEQTLPDEFVTAFDEVIYVSTAEEFADAFFSGEDGRIVRLSNNIRLGEWQSAERSIESGTVTLDGNGFTISYYTTSGLTTAQSVGLIRSTGDDSNVTIRNLGVISPLPGVQHPSNLIAMTIENQTIAMPSNLGGLIGSAHGSVTIENTYILQEIPPRVCGKHVRGALSVK